MKDPTVKSLTSSLLTGTGQYYYITTDITGCYTYVNDAFTRQFGKTKSDYLGLPVSETVHPDDITRCEKAVEHCINHPGSTGPVMLRKSTANGAYMATYWEFAALQDEAGVIIGIECLGSNYSGEQAQRELQQMIQQVNAYINGIEDLLVIIDHEQHILRANHAFSIVTGKDFKALRGANLHDLLPETYKLIRQELKNPALYKKQYGLELPCGEGKWCEFITYPNPLGTLLIIRDITATVNVQEELRNSRLEIEKKETWFRKLLMNSVDTVVICDEHMNISYATSSTINMLGYEPAEMMGHNAAIFIHPDDLSSVMVAFQGELALHPAVHSVDMRVVRKDGSWIWVEAMGKNLMNDPDIEGMVIYLNDITLRKKAEEELAQSEKKHKAVVTSSYNGIIISDFPGKIISVNPALCRMFGYKETEFLAKSVQHFLDFNDPAIIRAMEVLHRTRRFKGEVWATRKSGEKFLVELYSSFLYRDEISSYYSTVIRDIDEERKSALLLKKREEILSAIAAATGHLATGADINASVTKAMEIIGKAMSVDRVCIFENHSNPATGEPLISQRYEWNGSTAAPQINNPALQSIPFSRFSAFMTPLLEKQPFETTVAEIKDEELKALFQSRDIVSILALPVYIKDDFWGFVGFDDASANRKWQTYEKDILQAFVSTLAGVMERIRAEQLIRESRRHYEVLFDENPLPLISFDAQNLHITNTNQAACKHYGYSKNEFLQLKMSDLFHVSKDAAYLYGPEQPSGTVMKSRHRKKNGKIVDVEITVQQLSAGEQQMRLLLIKDITEERRLQREKDLIAATNELLIRAQPLEENFKAAIHLMREEMDWDVAELWTPNYDHSMIRLEVFDQRPGLENIEPFYKISSTTQYSFMQFGTRPAYVKKQIYWVEDIATSDALIRKKEAMDAGFVSHVQIPVTGEDKIIGLLYLFSTRRKQKDVQAIHLLNILSSRLAAESEKRRKEEELDVFFSLSQDAMVIAGTDGSYKKANPAFCKITGYTEAELIDRKFSDLVHPNDMESSEHEFRRILREGQGAIFENRITTKAGAVRWLEWSSSFDEKDRIIVAAARDITDKKIAEAKLADATQAIRNSLEENKKILNYSLDIILTFRADGMVQSINPVCESVLGFTDTEITGEYLGLFIAESHIDDFNMLIHQLKENDLTIKQLEISCRHKNGQSIQMSWSVHWSGIEQVAFVVARDITRQKMAEEKLIISELRFRSFMNNNPAGAWINDENGVFIFVNNRYNQLSRLKEPIREGDSLNDLFDKEIIKASLESDQIVLRSGKPLEITQWLPRGDGSKGYFLLYKFPLTSYDGKPLIGGVILDITDKQLAEEENRRIKNAIDNATDATIMYDQHFHCIYINKAFEKLFGYSIEAINKRDKGCFVPENKTKNAAIVRALKQHGSWEGDIVVKNSSGETIYVSLRANIMRNEQHEIISYVGIFTNITERIMADRQIRETAEKLTNIMESISEGMLILTRKWVLSYANPAAEKILRINLTKAQGYNIFESFPVIKNTAIHKQLTKALKENRQVHFEDYFTPLERWYALSIYPLADGLTVYFSDITERKRSQMQLSLEREVFESTTVQKADIKTLTDKYLKGIENIFPGTNCMLLLAKEESQTLHFFSGPSIPADFYSRIDGTRIGPDETPCGIAAHSGKAVMAENILNDPKWDKCRDLAAANQLQGCWSQPLINTQGKIFGTFAIYYKNAKQPDETEIIMVQRAAKFIAIIFENIESEKLLRLSNERYMLATKATGEAVWDWDVSNNSVAWSDAFFSLFGYVPKGEKNSFAFWEANIHPEDRHQSSESLLKFVKQRKQDQWVSEYRFRRKDGSYANVLDKGFVLRDEKKKVYRMVGAMQDISERIRLERELTEEQVNKQKLMAQVAVEAQEKERAEIGNELHDNVNQLLTTTKLYLELAKSEEKNREKLINRSAKNIAEVIHEIRILSRSLVPHAITDLGMVASINDLIETIQLANLINIRFVHHGDLEDAIPSNLKITIFRIMQEQMNNIIKHAYANEVLISIVNDGKEVHLNVSDNGVGFNMKKVKRGIGISNIISRANLFNGKVNIQSKPGKGCMLSVDIPL